jgi:hypothetical protein
MSAYDYYENPEEWGNYQNVTLEEIINDFMAGGDPDDYTSTVTRAQVLIKARRALQELYFDVSNDIRAISLTIDKRLTMVLPPDYVDYVRISWVDQNGILHPIAANRNKAAAQTYLQDHEYNILFDGEGCVLTDSSYVASAGDSLVDGDKARSKRSDGCECYGFAPNVNFANVYNHGSFVVNKSMGVIQFSSDIESKSIVLEYVSDGLFRGCSGKDDGQISIHKFCESAVQNYIYFELIKNRRNVPYNEKARARKEYYNSRRIAKRRLGGMKLADILQAFKGGSRWIKA